MDDILQLAGLPLHPLLVHAVVVLTPLVALAVLLAQFWPAARRRLGVVTPLGALVVLVLVPVTVSAGESLAAAVGPVPAVQLHQRYGEMLLPWTIALFVVALAQWVWFRGGRRGVPSSRRALARVAFTVLAVASVIVAVGTVILLVLIGDSGARAVWGGLLG
ncbi:hypothetical protein SAMN04489806_1279 [Paramicrobacterium humi]|uniref:DUF2231 domain-containing protein n=1 Tax=Paramicrobacterium humi TaxID=640635 RepID=A0A1H4KT56_9MICO|nr:DUF2231 domain-containing protein [Microbacterium humi]SEB61092.1 hypothetical protein SAMN04489806_1279 [Microbacterium humi]